MLGQTYSLYMMTENETGKNGLFGENSLDFEKCQGCLRFSPETIEISRDFLLEEFCFALS